MLPTWANDYHKLRRSGCADWRPVHKAAASGRPLFVDDSQVLATALARALQDTLVSELIDSEPVRCGGSRHVRGPKPRCHVTPAEVQSSSLRWTRISPRDGALFLVPGIDARIAGVPMMNMNSPPAVYPCARTTCSCTTTPGVSTQSATIATSRRRSAPQLLNIDTSSSTSERRRLRVPATRGLTRIRVRTRGWSTARPDARRSPVRFPVPAPACRGFVCTTCNFATSHNGDQRAPEGSIQTYRSRVDHVHARRLQPSPPRNAGGCRRADRELMDAAAGDIRPTRSTSNLLRRRQLPAQLGDACSRRRSSSTYLQ